MKSARFACWCKKTRIAAPPQFRAPWAMANPIVAHRRIKPRVHPKYLARFEQDDTYSVYYTVSAYEVLWDTLVYSKPSWMASTFAHSVPSTSIKFGASDTQASGTFRIHSCCSIRYKYTAKSSEAVIFLYFHSGWGPFMYVWLRNGSVKASHIHIASD